MLSSSWASLVGRALDFQSHGRGFDPHVGPNFFFFGTLSCLFYFLTSYIFNTVIGLLFTEADFYYRKGIGLCAHNIGCNLLLSMKNLSTYPSEAGGSTCLI